MHTSLPENVHLQEMFNSKKVALRRLFEIGHRVLMTEVINMWECLCVFLVIGTRQIGNRYFFLKGFSILSSIEVKKFLLLELYRNLSTQP